MIFSITDDSGQFSPYNQGMLTRAQLVTLGVLLALPLLIFAGVGAWALWHEGWLFWLSWTIPVCWGLMWLLLRWWKKPLLAPLPELDETHWTPRDAAAAEIVRRAQEDAKNVPASNLVDTKFYASTTQELAEKIARHYHPRATDPVGNLTVLEILAATQLVSEDLGNWFEKNVPGSHLINVAQWRLLSNAPTWWQYASNAGWIASIMMNPVNLGRYFVSKLAVDPLSRELQGSLLTAFYMLYLRQVGYYLIEMNSGRLRAGAGNYRRIMSPLRPDHAATNPASQGNAAPTPGVTVSIAVIGQVKAGKSSLINTLLGDQQAVVDVLPSTRSVQRYHLKSLGDAGTTDALHLMDTAGYGEAGASREQFAETLEAVRQADLVLVVLDGKTPAKQADSKVLAEITGWYRDHPQYKPPPMVGVVSKIDALSPLMEWQPPYHWERPRRPKEESIAGAIEYVREQLGLHFEAVVPVCTDRARDRIYGVDEFLVPAMSSLLTEARAVSLVKALHQEQDRGKVLKVVHQAMSAGLQLIEHWQQRKGFGAKS